MTKLAKWWAEEGKEGKVLVANQQPSQQRRQRETLLAHGHCTICLCLFYLYSFGVGLSVCVLLSVGGGSLVRWFVGCLSVAVCRQCQLSLSGSGAGANGAADDQLSQRVRVRGTGGTGTALFIRRLLLPMLVQCTTAKVNLTQA